MADKKIAKDKAPDKQHLALEVLRYQETNMRLGNAAMKTRGEVRGGGAKPYKQKGTGRARQGSIRAIQWVGGGRAFGSRKHAYHLKMNKKARRAALLALIESKDSEGRIVREELNYETPSTKKFISFMSEKEIAGKVLFMYGADTPLAVLRSARNIPGVTLLHHSRINARELLNNDWIVVCNQDAGILTPAAAATRQGE